MEPTDCVVWFYLMTEAQPVSKNSVFLKNIFKLKNERNIQEHASV
jgi:hypothetical protein